VNLSAEGEINSGRERRKGSLCVGKGMEEPEIMGEDLLF